MNNSILRVKDLLKSLTELIKENPECADFPIIYSHDDEGNEYQRVINPPNIVQLHNPNQKSYRNLEIVGFKGEDDINDKDLNAVVIN